MNDRVEVVTVENGFEVVVWKTEEDGMYSEPKKYVATSKEEAIELVKEHL